MYIPSPSSAVFLKYGSFEVATTLLPGRLASTLPPKGSQNSPAATLPLTIAATASSMITLVYLTSSNFTPFSSSQMPM